MPHWRPDLVSFLLGCSFTFEGALAREGLSPPNAVHGRNVPMYVTSVMCRDAGVFKGIPVVVSMRHYKAGQVGRVVEVTEGFGSAHGGPVHYGDPKVLGIQDLMVPDYGDPPVMEVGDVPVFWACGVTSQVAVMRAGVEVAVCHAPGKMFVADVVEQG